MMLGFDTRGLIDAGRKPAAVAVAGCAVALYIAYDLAKFKLSTVWPPNPRGDAGILLDVGQWVFVHRAYPPGQIFPYPPPAVVIFRGLDIAGPPGFMATWYLLIIAGLIVTIRASLVRESRDVRAAWLAIGFAAILCADLPLSSDLRNANSNLVYLGLVMAGYGLLLSLPILAGIFIGLSASLKLYSGLLLLWLAVNGPKRTLFAAAATAIVLWIVLPVALFGAAGTTALYAGWREQLATIGDPALHAELAGNGGPPLVTLQRAVVNLTSLGYGSAATTALVMALWAIWIAALLWYGWRCYCSNGPTAPRSRAVLADWTVLLLAPLLFSPWLELHHCVPVLAAALLYIAVALDDTMTRRDRTAAVAVLGTLLFSNVVVVPFTVRGLGIEAQFLVVVLVLAYLRPRLGHQAPAGKIPKPPLESYLKIG